MKIMEYKRIVTRQKRQKYRAKKEDGIHYLSVLRKKKQDSHS